MKPFPYPIHAEDLLHFCHPDPSHPLGQVYYEDTHAICGNGYLALRSHRGLWLHTDFEYLPPEVDERFSKVPWGKMSLLAADEWRELHDVKHHLVRHAAINPWCIPNPQHPTLRYRLTPSPIWRVGYAAPVRLSLLQLIARLPKCEVFVGDLLAGSPTFFRYAGGQGAVMPDPKLDLHSFRLFDPCDHHPLDGPQLKTRKKETIVFRGFGTQTVAEVEAERTKLEAREFIQED